MSRLQELIAELCPDGVEYRALGELLDYEQPGKYIVASTDYSDEYSVPVLTAGKGLLLGYTDETEGVYVASNDDPVIIFDDFTTSFHWITYDFKVKSSAMKMLRLTPNCSCCMFRYAYYAMKNIDYAPESHTRQWIGTYSAFRIPVPPIEVQHEVVRILDEYTAAHDELVRQLEEEMRLCEQQLTIARNELLKCDDEVRWATLEEIAWVGSSKRVFAKEFEAEGIPFFRGTEIGMFAEKKQVEPTLFISREHYEHLYAQTGSPCKGDLLFPSICPDGRVWLVDRDDPFYIKDGRVLWIHPTDRNIDSAYLCYAFSQFLRSSYNKLASGTSFAELKIFAVKKCRLPFPSLDEQKRIAFLLDGLTDAVDDSIRRLNQDVGLQLKQLSLVRNQLMSFPEKVA